jgi:uncharacterized coiled-coil DUF342 family protein
MDDHLAELETQVRDLKASLCDVLLQLEQNKNVADQLKSARDQIAKSITDLFGRMNAVRKEAEKVDNGDPIDDHESSRKVQVKTPLRPRKRKGAIGGR